MRAQIPNVPSARLAYHKGPPTARMTPAAIAGAALAGALIALAFGATSAAAQSYAADGPYVDEVIVSPLYRGSPDRLSRVVSIRDLDLTTLSGREVLRLRIRDTARDICRELGEDRFSGSAITSSCVDQAIRDARPQVRLAQRQAWTNRSYAYLEPQYPYDSRIYP